MKKLNPVNLTAESVDNMLSFETLSEMNKSQILGGAGEDQSAEAKEQKCKRCENCDKCKDKCASGCGGEASFTMSSPYLPF